jgi:hypothetical protein
VVEIMNMVFVTSASSSRSAVGFATLVNKWVSACLPKSSLLR